MKATKRRQQYIWCWLFILPTTLFYIGFQAWPIISSVYYATLDWSGIGRNRRFVGIKNFIELLKDEWFWNAFSNSFKYMLYSVPLLIIFSLFLAVLLNEKRLRYRSAFRTMFFLPVITTASIVGIIMQFIWSPTGAINAMLQLLGVENPVNFLGQSTSALPTVALIGVWKDTGIYMIYWLAALQSVPQDIIEAAQIDGAGKWRVFRHITFPIILPIGAVITLLAVINSLKVFDIVQTMTGGGPYFATDVMGTFVYRTAYASSVGMPRLGYASAAAMMFGICIILIGFILNVLKKLITKYRVD